MKKIVYYIPAATGVLLYGFLGILGSFTAISPWAWICVGILFLAGILMARGKWWGALPGVLIGIVLVLMSYISLTRIAGEVQTAQQTLSELKSEGAKLTLAYENAFNLNEVEEYATKVLGMTKLSDDRVTVLSMAREDKAEILNADASSSGGVLAAVEDFFGALVEYFE